MRDDNPEGFKFSSMEERELSKAVHTMVTNSRRYDEVLDTAVGNAVHEMMKDDAKTSFNKTLTLLNNGLSYAIDRVIGSSIFDNCEKGSYRGKTRFSSSPRTLTERRIHPKARRSVTNPPLLDLTTRIPQFAMDADVLSRTSTPKTTASTSKTRQWGSMKIGLEHPGRTPRHVRHSKRRSKPRSQTSLAQSIYPHRDPVV